MGTGSQGERLPISEEEKDRLVSILKKTMELGLAAVYSQEDSESDAVVDCQSRLTWCRSICCTFNFALTKDEVKRGLIKHDPDRPFFIASDKDGYCPHLERGILRCSVWADRPMRCRKYDCTGDSDVRPENIDGLIRSALKRMREKK
jgi:Fe-S-cluster containining protein